MNLLKNKSTVMTVVNNETLHFVVLDPNEEERLLGSLSLDEFLGDNMELDLIPEEVRHGVSTLVNSLLIVPDYWFGDLSLKFQSRKRSIVEPFIERKVQAQYPDLPDIKYFINYTFYQADQGEPGIHVYFMQDPTSFHLYNKLAEFNLSPRRITTPAFLWQQKLQKIISEFDKSGKALVYLLSTESFLYFFYQGNFLFSRSIALSDSPEESSDRFNTLSYQINQSSYLFSQKVKAEIDQIYLLSSGEDDAQELSEILGREVKDLKDTIDGSPIGSTIAEHLGPAGCFGPSDLSPASKFLSISHKLERKELEWKPIQMAGIVVGLILLLLLIGERFVLWKWSNSSQFYLTEKGVITETEPRQALHRYNQALDLLLKETQRPSLRETIINVFRSLSDHVWIKEMFVEVETNPRVDIKGVITASGSDQFRKSLSVFLANLRKYFQGSRSLRMQDIDFETDRSNEKGYQNYVITLRFNLP
jgi:hypothetical protein